jgi:hypothetical protein
LSNNYPDFILIVEPWMKFQDFPRQWLANLGLRIFAVNRRDYLDPPNLCYLCKLSLNPIVIAFDDQHRDNDKKQCTYMLFMLLHVT